MKLKPYKLVRMKENEKSLARRNLKKEEDSGRQQIIIDVAFHFLLAEIKKPNVISTCEK